MSRRPAGFTWFYRPHHRTLYCVDRVGLISTPNRTAYMICAFVRLKRDICLWCNARSAWRDALLGDRAANFTGGAGALLRRIAERAGLDRSEAVLGVRAAVARPWADRWRLACRTDADAHFREGAASLAGGALDGGRACRRRVDRGEAVLCVWAAVARRRADGCLHGGNTCDAQLHQHRPHSVREHTGRAWSTQFAGRITRNILSRPHVPKRWQHERTATASSNESGAGIALTAETPKARAMSLKAILAGVKRGAESGRRWRSSGVGKAQVFVTVAVPSLHTYKVASTL
jgi:hypothetical protein